MHHLTPSPLLVAGEVLVISLPMFVAAVIAAFGDRFKQSIGLAEDLCGERMPPPLAGTCHARDAKPAGPRSHDHACPAANELPAASSHLSGRNIDADPTYPRATRRSNSRRRWQLDRRRLTIVPIRPTPAPSQPRRPRQPRPTSGRADNRRAFASWCYRNSSIHSVSTCEPRPEPAHHLRASLVNIVATEPAEGPFKVLEERLDEHRDQSLKALDELSYLAVGPAVA
jgi:hypothetical protein